MPSRAAPPTVVTRVRGRGRGAAAAGPPPPPAGDGFPRVVAPVQARVLPVAAVVAGAEQRRGPGRHVRARPGPAGVGIGRRVYEFYVRKMIGTVKDLKKTIQ